MTRAHSAALALCALAGLAAGCSAQQTQQAPNPFASRPATAVLKDGLILAAVKAQLTAIDPDSSTTLSVAVQDGVVTLRGTVRDPAAVRKDVAAARKTAGVKRVVANLRVDPRGPRPGRQLSDAALAARIAAAYTAQVGFQAVSVHVDRGTVTLEGHVKDAKTKAAVVAAARGTDGVRNVTDRIRVGEP